MAQRYDVAIVGARVAGSTLAALLARRGLSVLLLDKARFPSDTLSTHLIFGDSFGVWERAGAWPAIERIGAQPMEWIDWRRLPPATDLRGRVMPVDGHAYALCLRRVLLDGVLFENAAATPGVTALEGTRATGLLWEDGRVRGLRWESTAGGRTLRGEAEADLVVGADGRFSLVAEHAGAASYAVVPPRNFPFYSYFRGVAPVDPPAFEIWESEEAHGTVMVVPCDEGIWMCVVYTPQAEYDEFRRDHERLLHERLLADPRIGPRLEDAERIAPVRGRGDIVNFLRVPQGPGWALVGDAGQHKDPIFGQGIGDACRTADLLSGALVRAAGGELPWSEALAEFHASRDADLVPKFDLMVRGRVRGVAPADVELVTCEVGESEELTARYLNIFSGGSLVTDVFNAPTIERFKERRGAARQPRLARV